MYIKKGKIPACFIGNGLRFPDIPQELSLTPLEERLISPSLPFVQLGELPRGGQLTLNYLEVDN